MEKTRQQIQIEISDLLGVVDLNGEAALGKDNVERLEEYIRACNEAANEGDALVEDGVYDRLMEILRKTYPESELCNYIWEDSVDEFEDTDAIVKNNPMYSIQTVKSFDCDEILAYVKRLPDQPFDAHISIKLNGHGIRLKYANGDFIGARSRARSSAGRDLTNQLKVVLEQAGLLHIDTIESLPLCEVRGEWLLPFSNFEQARSYNSDIKTAFSGVASMGRDSASPEEWGLLRFVAYEFLADGVEFPTKQSEYEFLEEMGFEIPLNWVIEGLQRDTLIDELKDIVSDCESEVKPDENGENGYDYYSDGLVFTINDQNIFKSIGDDGSHYKFGNMALKVGYWKQDAYTGIVQCILWTKGKTKLSPVAIVADSPDLIEFKDYEDHKYIFSERDIANSSELGVVTASGNRVRRVPLYEPNNLLMLDAFIGEPLHFRYGGEAGVVPCFPDGTPLLDGKVKAMLEEDSYDYASERIYDYDNDPDA